jgi:HPt (histidine-containing phosphotransfer) domain-containing protein
MQNIAPPFEPLHRLFRGDPGRIARVLEIFERVTREDLERLERAYGSHDWASVGMLAHRMKAGCLQIGETTAAAGLSFLEQAVSAGNTGDELIHKFATTRTELDGVMMRVALYLATKDGMSK